MDIMCPLVAIPTYGGRNRIYVFHPLKLDIPNQDRLYLKPLDLGNGLDFKSTDGLAVVEWFSPSAVQAFIAHAIDLMQYDLYNYSRRGWPSFKF